MRTGERRVDLNDRQAPRVTFEVRSVCREAVGVLFRNGPPGATNTEKWNILFHALFQAFYKP